MFNAFYSTKILMFAYVIQFEISAWFSHSNSTFWEANIKYSSDNQTHFVSDNQIHIGEESLNDILEPNAVMMAFFDRDRLDIVGISYKEQFY